MSKPEQNKAMEVAQPTYSARFTSMVVREFGATVGGLQLNPYQQRLAQHLFIAIDTQLRSLETKRTDQNKPVIAWANVNMEKLAIDSVHRIELGIDALIPNHLHPIPYHNSRTGKYDLDLRVGYVGKDYYHRKLSIDPPDDIIYELVYETDKFKPIKKSAANKVESYEFDVTDSFNRGKVIGGFGYLIYADPSKNKLILVSKADFEKSRKAAGSDKFWGNYEEQMQFKTLVTRVTSKLNIDPEKVSAAFLAVEMDDNAQEIAENANQEFIDISPEPPKQDEPKKKAEPAKKAKKAPADESPDNPNRVFLVCPETIDNHRPRKAIEVCEGCKDRMQCDPFTEYMMENSPDAGEAVQGELRPDF